MTRREKIRQMTLDEINTLSLEIIAEQGIEGLTIHGIARRMGMTAPAFYRYYKNRDALIKSLILSAYASFVAALESSVERRSRSATAVQRLQGLFTAYRAWAVAHPNLFVLFAGKKVQGFEEQDPEILSAAERVNRIFLDTFHGAWPGEGKIRAELPAPVRKHIEQRLRAESSPIPLAVVQAALESACLVHGMISMELSGRLEEMVGDPAAYYNGHVLALLGRFGISQED